MKERVEETAGLDLIDKVGVPPAFEGAVNTSGIAEQKTLYFHSPSALSSVDQTNEFAGGPGPYMDPTPPTGSLPKVATATGGGNNDYRKNFLNAYWGGAVNGVVNAPTVTFWLLASGPVDVEVSIFGDGGMGAASPVARTVVPVTAAGPTRVDAAFPGLQAEVQTEMVVQVIATIQVEGDQSPAAILFDSVDFPSSISFMLAPLAGALPALDDPFGILQTETGLIAANSGTGDVVRLGADGKPAEVLIGGLVPGGFARGVTGLAVDASGTLYAAVADTGEVLFLTASGARGVYARGLGTPTAIAFDAAGNLLAADGSGKRVAKVAPSGEVSTVASLPGTPYGLAIAPDGTLAVSTQGSGAVLGDVNIYSVNPGSGTTSILAEISDLRSAEGLAYAELGNLYIGSGRSGEVLRLTPTGELSTVASGLGGPLNLAFPPGGNTLIVATQGEGRAAGDAIVDVDAGEPGLALAAPPLTPSPLPAIPRAWVHRSGARALDPSAWAGPLPETELRLTGGKAFEPTLGVQSDGDIFFVGGQFDQAGGVLGSPDVYRSRDAGRTWVLVTPKDPAGLGQDAPPITLDPYLWVDPATDRVFTADLLAGCMYLSYTDDDGESWTTNPTACGVPPVDHQTFVGGPPKVSTTNGYPSMLYHCSNWVGATPCGRSFDGGDSWQPAGVAYVGTDQANRPGDIDGAECGGMTAHMVTDPEGRVFLPKGHCGRPYVAVSEDDGLTWTQHLISATVGANDHETAIASDSAGNLYATWIGTDRLPYLATSTDHGSTWVEARMIAPPGVTEADIPTITAGAPGSIAMLYMGTTADYGYEQRNYAKAGWNGYIAVSTDALSADPTFASTTVNPLTDPLVRGECGPGRCQNVFDFLDIVTAPDGRVWASFVDTCTGPCPKSRAASSTDAQGAVAPLLAGPNLLTGSALEPLP